MNRRDWHYIYHVLCGVIGSRGHGINFIIQVGRKLNYRIATAFNGVIESRNTCQRSVIDSGIK